MRSTAFSTLLLAFAGLGLSTASEAKQTYGFSTGKDAIQQTGHTKALRQRRAAKVATGHLPTPSSITTKEDKRETLVTAEDKQFWDRMLDESMGSMPPTPAPSSCPVRIEIECTSTDGSGTKCVDLQPPASGIGDDCIVEVEYQYIITNDGDDVERIYSVQVTRGDMSTILTDIPDVIPTTDLAPGDTVVGVTIHELDICTAVGVGVFDTQADVLAGPPCDVEVIITCESEEGEECMSISDAPTPDDCLIDVTYTYTVENIGLVDANIIIFSRERDGEFADLVPLLDSTAIELGGTTIVQETEEIDRCVDQTFTTNTIVRQVPNADLLCKDTGFYP